MHSREIGSEFWKADCGCKHFPVGQTYLSGRTALTAVILDMKATGVRSVCIPDYCCESMIEPFLRQDMAIGFYPVSVKCGGIVCELDQASGFDAVLLVDYFGFLSTGMDAMVRICQTRGQIVLLDQTHALFSRFAVETADYIFGSFRKWTGIEAGIAKKHGGDLLPSWRINKEGQQYLFLRKHARETKANFVVHNYADEQERKKQLALFAEAEQLLDSRYCSDTDKNNKRLLEVLNVKFIQERRHRNAQIIYKYLNEIDFCKPMFSELRTDVVPLTIPILVHGRKRDELRRYLRNQGVFCPVHWPVSFLHNVSNGAMRIYQEELSLICDQRYDEEDMRRMMEIIQIWNKI